MNDYDNWLYNQAENQYCDDREIVSSCACCGEPIRDEDEYFEVAGKHYCICCVEKKTA